MESLRHARRRFPFARHMVEQARKTLFDRLLASGCLKTMHPLPAVAILRNNEDLFPTGKTRAELLDLYADRLAALDLNDEAKRAREKAKALLQPSVSARSSRSGVLRHAGIGGLALVDEASEQPGKVGMPQSLVSVAAKKSQPGILDATSVRLVLAEADKAAAAGNHARLGALRRTYLDRVPKGLDRVLFNLATAPSLGPAPELDAALRQIAIIERLGTALGKSGGKGKASATTRGETPPASSLLPPAPGSAGS